MTTIQFIKQNGILIGYCAFGHSGFSQKGEDIVCASISIAVQMTATGIKDVKKLKPTIQYQEEPAKFSLVLHHSYQEAQDLLETLYRTMVELSKQYPKYVKLEVIEKC